MASRRCITRRSRDFRPATHPRPFGLSPSKPLYSDHPELVEGQAQGEPPTRAAYHGRMASASSIQTTLTDGVRAFANWLHNWWRIAELGAQLLTLALWPSSYTAAYRHALLRHIVLGTAPSLVGFTVLTTLLSLIVIPAAFAAMETFTRRFGRRSGSGRDPIESSFQSRPGALLQQHADP